MLRFTVRDLLWVTLVVALTLGWFVHQRQLRAEIDRADSRATKWRRAAGTLEYVLTEQLYRLEWNFDKAYVRLYLPSDKEDEYLSYNLVLYEPSVHDD